MRRTPPVRPVETQDFASLQSDTPVPEYNPSVWQRLVEWLHKQKGYDPKRLTDPEPRAAIEETRRILAKPLNDLAITQDIPEELTATLDQNIFFFSGFKTHHELVEASRMLKGDDGNFKPFQQFLKDVETINKVYNRNYLQAEYNFATASTQMAVKWKEWEQEGDRYDLQYRTAGDSRVREEHAALDGITLPPSDPFWDSYLPPNGWNCRCTAVQVRQGKYPRSDSAAAMAAGANCTDTPKKQIFRFNPGKQEKIFPPKHPYFPKGCGDCQYRKERKLYYNPDNPNCQACDVISKCLKAFNQPQKEAADKVLLWGKKNIIGFFTYQNEAFGGKTASFVKNSFTENLRRGDLFFAKVDVLNNIKKYLDQNLHFEKEDAVHGSGTYFYKTTIKYLGNDPAGVGRDMELQFKEYPDGKIHFYFIKFI